MSEIRPTNCYIPRCPQHPGIVPIEVRGHLECPTCHWVVETCCEGGAFD